MNFLEGKGCAKLITEKDFDKKVDMMVEWLRSITKKELTQMGKNGLAEIQSKYTKEIVTGMYADLVKELIGE